MWHAQNLESVWFFSLLRTLLSFVTCLNTWLLILCPEHRVSVLGASQRNLPLLYGWMLTENWSRFCPHGKKKIPKGQVLSKFSASSLSIFVAFCSFWRYTKYTDQKTFSVQMCFIALLPVTYLGSVGISWSSEYKILC